MGQIGRPVVRIEIEGLHMLRGAGGGERPLHLRGGGHEHHPVANVSGSGADVDDCVRACALQNVSSRRPRTTERAA